MIRKLADRLGALRWTRQQRSRLYSADDLLAGEASSADLARILPLVLDGGTRPEVAQRARERIAELLARLSPAELIAAEKAFRDVPFTLPVWFSPAGHYRYDRQHTDLLRRIAALSEEDVSVYGLLSFHESGYVREAALDRLAAIADGSELPFVVLRLNDWVEPVAALARRAFHDRLTPEYGEQLIAHRELIRRLQRAGRRDLAGAAAAAERIMVSTGDLRWLEDDLTAADHRVRSHAFRLARSAPSLAASSVLESALNDPHPPIRLWALRSLPEVLSGEPLVAHVERATGDSDRRVRLEALALLRDVAAVAAEERLEAALLDHNSGVREFARYWLAKAGERDFAAVYRAALSARGSTLLGAIGGLGETGDTTDAARIESYLAASGARVRAAAVAALARLDGARYRRRFLELLTDPSGRVVRAAVEALRPHIRLLGPAALLSLPETHPQAIRSGLRLARELNRWDTLEIVLTLSAQGDRAANETQRAIDRWLAVANRSFGALEPEQRLRLEALVGATPYRRDELLFALRSG